LHPEIIHEIFTIPIVPEDLLSFHPRDHHPSGLRTEDGRHPSRRPTWWFIGTITRISCQFIVSFQYSQEETLMGQSGFRRQPLTTGSDRLAALPPLIEMLQFILLW